MSGVRPWLATIPPLAVAAIGAVGMVSLWRVGPPASAVALRLPAERVGDPSLEDAPPPLELARLVPGPGAPSELPGSWPGFRGPNLDGVSPESVPLADRWPASGPPVLWSIEVGEGYAGPAIHRGRVYLVDYDREAQADAVRCLSLADGREIWRFTYPVVVKRNHGMSRTIPAVTDRHLVALGPMGHVSCLDATSGEFRWGIDLVREFGTTIPPWYAGQCPLVDGDRVVLAPAGGGPDQPLLMAVDLESGEVVWSTPNTLAWKMTHASVAAAETAGRRSYVYCGHRGVAGVAADDGSLLWSTGEWRISIATVPTPVPVPGDRLFLSGGYQAGSMMLRVEQVDGSWHAVPQFRLGPEVFGATQQTPIWFDSHLFGVRPDGELTCLAPDGTPSWSSGPSHRFGLGPFLVADGKLLVLDDDGRLTMAAASSEAFRVLATARVLDGHDCWGPMALAGGRLLIRDLTRLSCLDLRKP